ncbi:MAG: HAMP domain-containing protein, partial [Acidimicrobiaceae bacterium]|nr:HAMP domain-containing protein [Acidimicrobiaceae bacterium]
MVVTTTAQEGDVVAPQSTERAFAVDQADLAELAAAIDRLLDGEFSTRVTVAPGPIGDLATKLNKLAARQEQQARELSRISRLIGREGRMAERLPASAGSGDWADSVDAINSLIDELVRPTTEVARVIEAVAAGDLSQQMAVDIDGQPVKGEFRRIGAAVNRMVDQLSSFADEVTR